MNDKLISRTAMAVTIGCRLNQADTALIFGRLVSGGYTIIENSKKKRPDLIIVNSCAVTASASQKSRQAVRAAKKKHPDSTIVVTGCSVVVEKNLWLNEAAADIILSNSDKPQILSLVNEFRKYGKIQETGKSDSAKTDKNENTIDSGPPLCPGSDQYEKYYPPERFDAEPG